MANEDLKAAKQLLEEINTLRRRLEKEPLQMGDDDLVKNFSALNDILKDTRQEFGNIEGSASSLYGQLQGVTSELSTQGRLLSKTRTAFDKVTETARQLAYDEQGISELQGNRVKKLAEEAKVRAQIAKDSAAQFVASDKVSSLVADINKEIQEQKLAGEDVNDFVNERLKTVEGLKDEEKALLQLHYDQTGQLDKIVAKAQKRADLEKEINKNMGITGGLVTSLGKGLSAIGFDSTYLSDALEESSTNMRKVAREAAEAGKGVSRLKVAAAGLGPLFGGLADTLTDPAFIAGQIAKTFLKINKASVDLRRSTGQSATSFNIFRNGAASAVDILETASELTAQTGMNAQNIFSMDVLANAADLKVEMGLAADEAGGLAMLAQTTSGDVDGITDSIVDTTSAFNKANRSAVNQGQVLRDVAKTSDSIKASLGNNPKLIAEAASAARRMGMDLKRVDDIAGSLMNFESSIEAELEAQLLTGRDLNLAKARELALNNDLVGLSEELFKNSADINEFGQMNRIQQEAMAKALGMSRDELAKMAYNRALEAGMTEEQAAAAANVNAEDMKRISAQENFAKALEKIAGALAPILDFVGNILSMPLVPHLLLAGLAISKLGGGLQGALGSMGGMVSKAKELGKAVADKGLKGALGFGADKGQDAFAAAKAKGLSDKQILSGFGGKEAKDAMMGGGDKAADLAKTAKGAGDAAKGADGIPKGVGEKIKEFFTGLAAGLKEMASGKVIAGAGASLLAAPGLIGIALASPGLRLLGDVNGEKLTAFFEGLAGGLAKMANKDTLLGAGASLLAAPGLIALGLAAPGLFLLSMIPGKAISGALRGLGQGLAALGKVAMDPTFWVGIAALAGLGVALIPLTFALSLLAPLVESFGKVITAVFGGIATLITAVADGFVKIMGALSMDNILPLLLLGPALLGISAGLAAMAFTGIAALPVIGALAGLALVSTPLIALSGLFGGDDSKSDGDDKVVQKLDAILTAIQSGGDVYIDSNKVGQALVLGSYKSS